MGSRASRDKTKLFSRNDVGEKNKRKNTTIEKMFKGLAEDRQELNGPTILGKKWGLTRLRERQNYTMFPSRRKIAKRKSRSK